MSESWRYVDEAEALVFIREYPRKLSADICGIVEPPMLGYYDYERYTGVDALVAACSLEDGMGATKTTRTRWRLRQRD